jgi:Glycosyl hydrolases family 16
VFLFVLDHIFVFVAYLQYTTYSVISRCDVYIWFYSNGDGYSDEELKFTSRDGDVYRALKQGEIDLAEGVGKDPGKIHSVVHTLGGKYTNNTPLSQGFHKFRVQMTPTRIICSVDGKPHFQATKDDKGPRDWPFNKNKYIMIISLNVGGAWAGNKISEESMPWKLKIKSIQHTKYNV